MNESLEFFFKSGHIRVSDRNDSSFSFQFPTASTSRLIARQEMPFLLSKIDHKNVIKLRVSDDKIENFWCRECGIFDTNLWCYLEDRGNTNQNQIPMKERLTMFKTILSVAKFLRNQKCIDYNFLLTNILLKTTDLGRWNTHDLVLTMYGFGAPYSLIQNGESTGILSPDAILGKVDEKSQNYSIGKIMVLLFSGWQCAWGFLNNVTNDERVISWRRNKFYNKYQTIISELLLMNSGNRMSLDALEQKLDDIKVDLLKNGIIKTSVKGNTSPKPLLELTKSGEYTGAPPNGDLQEIIFHDQKSNLHCLGVINLAINKAQERYLRKKELVDFKEMNPR